MDETAEGREPMQSAEFVKCYEAAQSGDSGAQFDLGERYFEGDGVAESASQAVHWWRKAAEQGNGDAQHQLGLALCNGDGVPRDLLSAYVWLSLSSDSLHRTTFYSPSAEEILEVSVEPNLSPEQLREGRSIVNALASLREKPGNGP